MLRTFGFMIVSFHYHTMPVAMFGYFTPHILKTSLLDLMTKSFIFDTKNSKNKGNPK